MNTTLESVISPFSKDIIEWWLGIFTSVKVVGARMLEDGYELVLEGSQNDVDQLVWILANGRGKERGGR